MSDVSLSYEDFDDISNYDHFEQTEDAFTTTTDNQELNESQFSTNEAKLFIEILSLEGLPKSTNFIGVHNNYSLQIELGNEKFKKHFSPSLSNNSSYLVNEEDKLSSVFSIVEYYGLSQVKLVLKTKSLITGKKKCIGEHIVSLASLMNKQINHDRLCNTELNGWSVSDDVSIETNILMKLNGDHSTQNNSWLETAKSAATLSPSLVNGVSRGVIIKKFETKSRHNHQYSGFSTHPVCVRIQLQFRLVALKRCLQLSSTAVPAEYLKYVNPCLTDQMGALCVDSSQRISELHGFFSTAKPHEVIELLRALAASHCLSQALRLQSSTGFTVLDWALLAGNHHVVAEVLQRAGNLCFRDLVPNKPGPFHMAVHGGSKECLDTLWRFFKKYSNSESAVSFTAGAAHWSPTLFALMEWRDEDDNTPLSLACSLSGRDTALAELLLFAGANISAVNCQTDFTPLMQACRVGATDTVRMLLSIVKSNAEIDDTILTVNSSVFPVSNSQENALQRHLRGNPRSRNLLKGRDLASGGFLNPLSLYCCLPTVKELSSGRQAVHIAAMGGHGEIVCLLLEIGVSCAETDRHGDNVFHLLARGGYVKACELVVRCERLQWLAHSALVRDKLLQTMQTRRRSLCCENYRGKSCAEVAAEGGHFALAKLLLKASEDIYGDNTIRYAPVLQLLDEIMTHPPSSSSSQPTPVFATTDSNQSFDRLLPSPPPRQRPISMERDTTVRSRSSSCTDKMREKNGSEEKEVDDVDVLARDRAVENTPAKQPVDQHAQRLVSLRLAMSVCKSPSRRPASDGQDHQDDDSADDHEYLFALSALALRAMGDSSTAASLSTHAEEVHCE